MPTVMEIREHPNGHLEICVQVHSDGGSVWVPYADHWLKNRRVELPLGQAIERSWLEELELAGWVHPRNWDTQIPLLKLPESAPTLDHWDDGWEEVDPYTTAIVLALALIGALTILTVVALGLADIAGRIF